ncbi:MAG: D-alanyl-D-alanine carboxypeptidase [Patescibacteria group bacterium]
MKFRLVALFIFFTLLILFYPGESYFFTFFQKNKQVIEEKPVPQHVEIREVPSVLNNYPLELTAQGVYILDLPTYTPIYEKNIHQSLFPASTTKIITALVANDLYGPDDVITVKKIMPEGQVMGLVEGERITVENLLYAILVHSANDAAFALADSYGYDRYIKLMNEKALSLGMKDSHFRNPAGLDDPAQVTTPFDLALASRELLKHPNLARIVSIKEIIISDVDFKLFHTLSNVNKLLGETQGIGGLKTGYTDKAGENLVSFYKNNGHQFLIVILKSDDRFADTKNVVKWLNENVIYTNVSLSK